MQKKDEKREQVLKAARSVLEIYGIRKLTLDDVAKKAGLAIPSLYYYFKNKRELVRAVVRMEIAEISEKIDIEIGKANGPESKLKAIVTTLLQYANRLANLPGMNRMEHAAVYPDIAKDAEAARKRIRELIQGVIEEGNDSKIFDVAHPDQAALMISTGLVGMIETAFDGEFFKEHKNNMDYIMELLLNGFRKR